MEDLFLYSNGPSKSTRWEAVREECPDVGLVAGEEAGKGKLWERMSGRNYDGPVIKIYP